MVATCLSGGLGNQLFMYAAARALAERLGTRLVLNTNKGFVNDVQFKRKYELSAFALTYSTNPVLTFDFSYGEKIKRISQRIGRNVIRPQYVYLRDCTGNTNIDNRLLEIKSKNVFLDGYWQSAKYFEEYEQLIRKELVFPVDLELKLKEEIDYLEGNREVTHVCVGVRRYQECVKKQPFDILDEEYYLKAIRYLASKTPQKPLFHVYTQDIEWVNKNITDKIDYEIVIEKERSSIEDLCLMSKYKYHIISNSSFYWWGAWLADGELVVSTDSFINKSSNLNKWVVIK